VLERNFEQTGVEPPALANRPEENLIANFILSAFSTLSNHRQSGGMGMSALAFQDIIAYARLVGYTGADEILFFARLIAVCDNIYLQRAADKQKAQAKSNSNSKGKRRHG
jgi:hypothetical protein